MIDIIPVFLDPQREIDKIDLELEALEHFYYPDIGYELGHPEEPLYKEIKEELEFRLAYLRKHYKLSDD